MLTPRPDTKQTRIVRKTVPTESFFNFFSPPEPPAEDDEEADYDIEDRLELDYQLGEDIKEKLIPRAIDWFTGEALAYEEIDEDDLNEDFDDEDEDEDDLSEDHDDDDDSEDDDVRGASKILPRKMERQEGRADIFLQDDGSKPKPDAQECKQS